MLKIKLIKSTAKSRPQHKQAARGLGLRHTNHVVEREDNPRIRGLIGCAPHLFKVEKL